jgi:acetyltransferase-like isoleucine patch superfamily enzyme
VITRANELRHRARFAVWAGWLRLQLRRRGARLELDAPYGARMDGHPHVDASHAAGVVRITIGRGVRLGRGLHLDVESGTLRIGDGVTFGHAPRIQLRGGEIALGAGTTVRDGAVLKADGHLTVGEGALISYGAIVACSERIEIGARSSISERVSVVDSDHAVDGTDVHWARQPLHTAPVLLGRNVLISANATILRGAQIGDNAQVAAGAVVTSGEHPGGWLLAGVPAKPVKPLSAAAERPR